MIRPAGAAVGSGSGRLVAAGAPGLLAEAERPPRPLEAAVLVGQSLQEAAGCRARAEVGRFLAADRPEGRLAMQPAVGRSMGVGRGGSARPAEEQATMTVPRQVGHPGVERPQEERRQAARPGEAHHREGRPQEERLLARPMQKVRPPVVGLREGAALPLVGG